MKEITFAHSIIKTASGMLFNCYGKEHHRLMKNYRNMSCIEVADEVGGTCERCKHHLGHLLDG